MALIECSECESDVSDRAPTCPRCGNPIAVSALPPPPPPAYPTPIAPPPRAGSAVAAGNGLSTAGIICGIISLFVLWFIFGPLGLVLAGVAKSKGEHKANTAMAVSAIGTIGGAFVMFVLLF